MNDKSTSNNTNALLQEAPIPQKLAPTKKTARFSNMARVLTIHSLKDDLTEDERAKVWWQESDYNRFRRRSVTATSLSSQIQSNITTRGGVPSTNTNDCMGNDNSSPPESQTSDSPVANKGDEKMSDCETEENSERPDTKSTNNFKTTLPARKQALQRQTKARASIQAVLAEQKRQRASSSAPDPARIRTIYVEASSWARKYALDSLVGALSDVEDDQEEKKEERIPALQCGSASQIRPPININAAKPQEKRASKSLWLPHHRPVASKVPTQENKANEVTPAEKRVSSLWLPGQRRPASKPENRPSGASPQIVADKEEKEKNSQSQLTQSEAPEEERKPKTAATLWLPQRRPSSSMSKPQQDLQQKLLRHTSNGETTMSSSCPSQHPVSTS